MSTNWKYTLTVSYMFDDDWPETEVAVCNIVESEHVINDGGGTDFKSRDVEFSCETVAAARSAVSRLAEGLPLHFCWDIGEFYMADERIEWRQLDKGEEGLDGGTPVTG